MNPSQKAFMGQFSEDSSTENKITNHEKFMLALGFEPQIGKRQRIISTDESVALLEAELEDSQNLPASEQITRCLNIFEKSNLKKIFCDIDMFSRVGINIFNMYPYI